MSDKNSLSVILPVYNEAGNIECTIENILSRLQSITDDFEIIAINDGSIDQGGQIISRLARKYTCINFIDSRKNSGYGWALRQGINVAQKSWILLIDADGQFDIGDLANSWKEKQGLNFLLGWRKKRKDGFSRILLGAIGNCLANVFLWPRFFIKDVNCGFKLFKTQTLKSLPLISTGGAINFEILFLLKNSDSIFTQLPVKHYPRPSGLPTGGKIKTILKICKESLKIIFAYDS